MEGLLWVIGLTGLLVAGVALRRSFVLARDLKQLKRDHYYAENRVKRLPEELLEAVQPLRLQLATVAGGGTVSPELILAGRLYLEVSAEEAARMIEREGGPQGGNVALVDVRTPKEYVIKHAVGARSVPFEELEARYKEIPEGAPKVFLYCDSGERSRMACDFLSRRGYTNLYHVQDGLLGWHGRTEGEGEVKFIHLQSRR